MSITATGPGQWYFPMDVVENSFQIGGEEVSSGGLTGHRGGVAGAAGFVASGCCVRVLGCWGVVSESIVPDLNGMAGAWWLAEVLLLFRCRVSHYYRGVIC